METMYYLFNGLNFDVKLLVDQYNLVVDFDFFKEDDFYEIQIYSSIESDNEFYIAIGTQDGKNKLLLQDESEIVADQYTSDEIIGMFIDQIKEYHSKVD